MDKDFTGHLAAGLASFTKGVFSGLTGVVTQPIKSVRNKGIEGLVPGLARGAVGVVAKPLAGVFDLASSTTAAVRHSAGRKKRFTPRAR